MGDTLKPCPFCGGEAKTHGPYGWYSQWCISHSCKAFYTGAQDAFKDYPTEAQAITAWNTRADDGCIAELVEWAEVVLHDWHSETGFVAAVRETTGHPYPWEHGEQSVANLRDALAKVKGGAA